jgi:DNA-binding MarR family transcriptional regulator
MVSTFVVLETSRRASYAPFVAHAPLTRPDPADDAWRMLMGVFMSRKEDFPRIAASFGLNPGAMHALLSLTAGEPQSMSSLAGAWKCDASNVTWLVDRLEEHGLAERRAHPTDRRIRTVALTPKGAKLRTQIQAKLFEAPDVLRALPARDLDTLCRILAKIAPEETPRG